MELELHSSYFYFLLKEPMIESQLKFLTRVNLTMFKIMQRGTQYDELEKDPFGLTDKEIDSQFNLLTSKIKKYIEYLQMYIQKAY